METTRLRLEFKDEEGILSQSQKSEGLKRCWLLLKPHLHKTIADLSAYILHAFQLHPSCSHGLLLYMDGFVLPAFESTAILKDKDVIGVRKKGITLAVEGNNPVNLIAEMEAVKKQPVHTGALLLPNEEFEKETGGYQSDETKDESEGKDERDEARDSTEKEDEGEEEHLEEALHNSSQGNATSKKRKALEKLQGSKKKKQRSEVQSIEIGFPDEQIEKSCQDGVLAKESTHKEKKESKLKKTNKSDDAEPGHGNIATSPNLKRSDQIQKNGEEIKEASGETKKLPSRSARRKKAKRRWIREMAKIQKQDGISQPEELNWKKKPTRTEVKKYNNWKQKPAKPNVKEDDGQPKGLLYWKQWSGKDTSNDKRKPQANQNGSVFEKSNRKKRLDDEVVPVVTRPGHIRFEPSEKDQAVKQNQVSEEPFQWNGISSKRKDQKWGTEKNLFSRRNYFKDDSIEHPGTLNIPKEIHLNGPIDFEKLPSLSYMPKAGDVIGYRLLELSSTWTPELTPFRVGHVAWCSSKSSKLILIPVPGYPVISKNSDEEEPGQKSDNSLYKEDGSLEIDFSTLIDVRVVRDCNEGPDEAVTGEQNGAPAATDNSALSLPPPNNDKQTHVLAPENGGNVWEQLSEGLNAKKEELSQGNSWDKASSGKNPWSYSALKGSALGPTMSSLRSKKQMR